MNHFTGKGLACFIQKPYRMQALEEKLWAALVASGSSVDKPMPRDNIPIK